MTTAATHTRRAGRPSKKNAEEMSRLILETAAELFAKQGFAATSIEQVASACNAGKDTIYRRFPSKAALFQAVVENLRQQTLLRLTEEVLNAPDEGDALVRLKQLARWFLTINLDPQMVAFKRIAVSEAIVFGGEKADPQTEDPIFNHLKSLIVEAQNADMLASQAPADLLARHLLHSIVYGPTNDAMLGLKAFADTSEENNYFEKTWLLFLNGAQSQAN